MATFTYQGKNYGEVTRENYKDVARQVFADERARDPQTGAGNIAAQNERLGKVLKEIRQLAGVFTATDGWDHEPPVPGVTDTFISAFTDPIDGLSESYDFVKGEADKLRSTVQLALLAAIVVGAAYMVFKFEQVRKVLA